jgi:predicted ATPase
LGGAAVLGLEFELAVVADLVGRTEEDVLGALDHAARARLAAPVEGRPGRWSFTHALVRAARYEALSAVDRGEQHLRATELLAEQGAPAEFLTHHAVRALFAAGDPRPAQLCLEAAADAVARLAV